MRNRWIILACLVTLAAAKPAAAGEIQLRADVQCTETIVRLGDVADVWEANMEVREQLRAIDLFPAPAAGEERRVTAREVCDALVLRGVSLLDHRLSGSNVIRVAGPQLNEPVARQTALAESSADRAIVAVREATLRHIRGASTDSPPWELRFALNDEQVRSVLKAPNFVTVEGGREPWLGSQSFMASVRDPASGQTFRFGFTTEITAPPAVVVVVHPVNRGELIQASDVELRHDRPGKAGAALLGRVEDVVGLEATRTLAPGQYLDRDCVRRPVVVRRGDAVTVVARSPGIKVRTTARAREDGSQGDVIQVESMLNRQTFLARVSGIHEVEVYARAAEAGEPRLASDESNR